MNAVIKEKAVTIVAILAIAGLTILAVSKGMNGAIISTAFTFIGGLAGFQIGKTVAAYNQAKKQ